ncbi:MAG: transcription antitermination factor NusB [Gammaproteobacteria bacterium]|nr:transcription antitermination factor NusB [Gammaproteobacteria bacterium]
MTESKTATKLKGARHQARAWLVQLLYQKQIADADIEALLAEARERDQFDDIDTEFFEVVLSEVLADTATLDALVADYSDIKAEQLDPIERSVLWLSLYELKYRHDVPVKVVINEAIELTKEFGGEDGHKFVNAVLDQAASQLRPNKS